MIVNIHEAKTNLSRLIKRAFAGEEVIIARNGNPILKLQPLEETQQQRTPGLSRNKITYSKDFAEPLPEKIINEFEK